MASESVPVCARKYLSDDYQWSFQHIPPFIQRNGQLVPNPALDSAVFVVHGIGEQEYADTAVQLRNGFETAIADIQKREKLGDVPTPYISDGYWADYDNFKKTFPEEWEELGKGEKTFFTKLWAIRSHQPWHAVRWLARQAWRLIFDKEIQARVGAVRGTTYWGVALLAWVLLPVMYLLKRDVLSRILGDVVIYAEPQGVVQKTILARVHDRVLAKFLRMLGLDTDFTTLTSDDRLKIAGKPHAFKYVTWVAHSLGTVVSYNVISILMKRCAENRALLNKPADQLTEQQRSLLANTERVERGIHRFITLGSPLEKFRLLFPGALKQWPTEFIKRRNDEPRRWWVNIHHILDPVSGPIRTADYFPRVENLHSKIAQVPGVAHIKYWEDLPTQSYIVTRAYGKEILPATEIPPFISKKKVAFFQAVLLFISLPLSIALLLGIVLWGVPNLVWLLAHPKVLTDGVWAALKWWFRT